MEISYNDYSNNYNDGLGGMFSGISIKSIGNFVSKNIKSAGNDGSNFIKKHATLPNLITAVSIAAMVIPGGQAVAMGAKLAKLSMLAKVGNLAKGAVSLMQSPIGQMVMSKIAAKQPLNQEDSNFIDQIAVAQDVAPGVPNILDPNEFKALANISQKQADEPQVKLPPKVTEALANANPAVAGGTPEKPLKTKEPMFTQTMLMIGGGVLVLGGIAYLAVKK